MRKPIRSARLSHDRPEILGSLRNVDIQSMRLLLLLNLLLLNQLIEPHLRPKPLTIRTHDPRPPHPRKRPHRMPAQPRPMQPARLHGMYPNNQTHQHRLDIITPPREPRHMPQPQRLVEVITRQEMRPSRERHICHHERCHHRDHPCPIRRHVFLYSDGAPVQ